MLLGVSPRSARRYFVFLTSLIVGICVSVSGMIGFVGLVVPHFVRRYSGSLHSGVLILYALWGGIALVYSDVISRVVARPYEIPVGVLTALVGAPLFIYVLFQSKGVRR